MALPGEDVRLRLHALVYVIRLYDELTAENGAPTLGTQNQAVDFILAAPELRRAVVEWAATTNIEEATTAPLQRLPHDELYRHVRAYLEKITGRPGGGAWLRCRQCGARDADFIVTGERR